MKSIRPYHALALLALCTIVSWSDGASAAFTKGDVFASIGSGNVNHYAADGTFIETLNIGAGGFTTGSAFDGNGNLYVTGFSTNRVAKFDNNGNLVNSSFITTGLSTPESIVFDKSGNIYVGNLGTGIQKYGSGGGLIGNVISTRVDWLDLSADQNTFVFTQEGSTVNTVSNGLPGVSGPAFASGLSTGFALRLLGDGGLLVADGPGIKRFDSGGNLIQSYDVAGVSGQFALNLDPDGTSFWSGSFADGILRRFDIASGAVLQSINTTLNGGCAGSCLFGVSVFGEITQGGPGPGPGVVPEPTTWLLMLMGLAGLGLMLHRKGTHSAGAHA